MQSTILWTVHNNIIGTWALAICIAEHRKPWINPIFTKYIDWQVTRYIRDNVSQSKCIPYRIESIMIQQFSLFVQMLCPWYSINSTSTLGRSRFWPLRGGRDSEILILIGNVVGECAWFRTRNVERHPSVQHGTSNDIPESIRLRLDTPNAVCAS